MWKLQEDLLSSPQVANCALLDGTAYVVPARNSGLLSFLARGPEERDFKDYLIARLGHAEDSLPEIRLVDALPGDFDRHSAGRHDAHEWQLLLEEAEFLQGGGSFRCEEERGLRALWQSIEAHQKFLPPTRVFEADTDVLPPKDPNHVRFVCISDTHGRHRDLTGQLPPGDVLLHAGDFSTCGDLEELRDFGFWLREQPFQQKVVIAGNHELALDRFYEGHGIDDLARSARAMFEAACGEGTTYLEDEELVYRGIRIYGTPWQPAFGEWAFNLPRGPKLASKWDRVPLGTDILLVHGPPLGRGDKVLPCKNRTGCADLLTAVQERVRPAFCVYGHIHESRGVSFDGATHYVNATSTNFDHRVAHAPFVFDMPARR